MNPEKTPEATLMQAMFGFMVSKGLSVVAELKVADELSAGPTYYIDLAQRLRTDQRSLHRVLRLLASVGIFAEPEPGQFENNEVSELLKSDHPASLRDMAAMITSDSHWLPWGKLAEVVRTGVSGPHHAFGKDIFSWFQDVENREEWEVFNNAMSSFSSSVVGAVTEAYDFSGCRKIVDVGGGHGFLLRRILERAPSATGMVFDLPGVVKDTDTMEGRIEPIGGDFFKGGIPAADTYLLKHIIHDWGDDQSTTILRNIADVMEPAGRVLLVELVMPETDDPHPAKFMDVNMLAMTEGGCERTEAEYASLFSGAGLQLVRIHPTASPVSLVEAAKA